MKQISVFIALALLFASIVVAGGSTGQWLEGSVTVTIDSATATRYNCVDTGVFISPIFNFDGIRFQYACTADTIFVTDTIIIQILALYHNRVSRYSDSTLGRDSVIHTDTITNVSDTSWTWDGSTHQLTVDSLAWRGYLGLRMICIVPIDSAATDSAIVGETFDYNIKSVGVLWGK